MTKIQSQNRHKERGSVLFYILLAVALLASLSFAVSQGNRGGKGINQERANLAATEILEYANIVKNAVTQLKLRGCSDEQISFENNGSATNYTNTNAPADNSCHVFHISGGGVQYQNPVDDWLDPAISDTEENYGEILFTAKTCIDQVGTGIADCQSETADAAELAMAVLWIRREICIALNNKLGVGDQNAAPPVDLNAAWGGTPQFIGTYIGGVRIQDSGNILDGTRTACFEGGGTYPQPTPATTEDFHFYNILLAR